MYLLENKILSDYLNVNTMRKASPSFPDIHIINRKKEI